MDKIKSLELFGNDRRYFPVLVVAKNKLKIPVHKKEKFRKTLNGKLKNTCRSSIFL